MVLPFILLSPMAGKLAERHKKSSIYKWAKVAEIPLVLIASAGFYLESIGLVLFAMLLMGIQSALYSPSKYGLIKEYVLKEGLKNEGKTNKGHRNKGTGSKLGVMELLSFSAVLIGTLIAGFVADSNEYRNLLLVGLMLFTAVLGFIQSSFLNSDAPNLRIISKKNGCDLKSNSSISTVNPLKFVRLQFTKNKSTKGVNLAVFGLGVFWFIASMIQMNLLVYCPSVLGLTASATGIVNALVAVGIGVGCFVAGVWNKERVALGSLFFSITGLGICLLALVFTNSYFGFVPVLMLAAFFGGLFKIPLNAWVQDKTDKDSIGGVLAYSNMVVFVSILLSAVVFALVSLVFTSAQVFLMLGILSLVVALVCLIVQPIAAIRSIAAIITKVIFRVRVAGVENLPEGGGIVACNHVSMLDALLILLSTKRNVRFVMHEAVYNHKLLKPLFKKCHMIPIASGKGKAVLTDFTARVKAEVEAGRLVCIFPEGHLNRTGQLMSFKKGIEKLAMASMVPIVPMHLHNVIGSPLTFVPGSNKTYSFHPKNWRKKVFVSIGSGLSYNSTAFEIRQAIKELEVENVAVHIKTVGSDFSLSQNIPFVCNDLTRLKLDVSAPLSFVVNCPSIELKDLMKKSSWYIGSKEDRNGKPIPGVSVQVRNETGVICDPLIEGFVYLKSAYQENLNWVSGGVKGFIDECGFVKFL